jgi:hypothetical protein
VLRLCLFFLHAVLPARGALAQHFIGDRWLFKCRASPELFQNAGALILLFKAAQCAIDRLVFLDYNAYQVLFPPL